MKSYNVNFELAGFANFVVRANSIDEAIKDGERALSEMCKEEIIERLVHALEYFGAEINSVSEC